MRKDDSDVQLAYAAYALVIASNIKDGKKDYKKTEKVLTDMSAEDFIKRFVAKFPSYSQHQIEAWLLNAIKNAAFNPVNQPPHAIVSVSDFAQNLNNDKKVEVSEEHFHKSQTALFGTVTSISTPIQN